MSQHQSPILLYPCIELSKIRLLSCDVDGVLTDGGLYYDDEGHEFRRFHVQDGLGLQLLQAAGVTVAFISRSQTTAIQTRAERLGINHCFTAVQDKLSCLKQLAAELQLTFEQIAHVGDDINDLELLQSVAVPLAVANAVPEVIACSRFITRKPGGSGAVREIADTLLASLKLHK